MPGDSKTEEKQCEKEESYQDLAREIIRGLWKTTANVMAIIEGTVGGVASRDEHMSMLNEYKNCVGYLRLLVGLYILRRRRGNIL